MKALFASMALALSAGASFAGPWAPDAPAGASAVQLIEMRKDKRPVATPQELEELAKVLAAAQTHFQNHRYPEAYKMLTQALNVQVLVPNNVYIDFLMLRAQVTRAYAEEHESSGDYKAAIVDLNQILKVDAKYFLAYASRSQIFLALNEFEAARRDADAWVDLQPNSSEAVAWRGAVQLARGRVDDAVADFTAAIDANPKNVVAYFGRAAGYLLLRKISDAEKDGLALQKVDERNAFGYFVMGQVRVFQGKFDEATAEYKRGLEFTPNAHLLKRGLDTLTVVDAFRQIPGGLGQAN